MKLLLVEDQKYPLRNLQAILKMVFPDLNYDVSRCFSDAKIKIEATSSSKPYDLILLDHRMPLNDSGTLEDNNFKEFCNLLNNVGYTLIPLIKKINPKTVVIGTSSLEKEELSHLQAPDFTISKTENLDKNVDIIKKIVEDALKKYPGLKWH